MSSPKQVEYQRLERVLKMEFRTRASKEISNNRIKLRIKLYIQKLILESLSARFDENWIPCSRNIMYV